jgi:uncharacterized protein YlxW (UPF0749 family)
MMLRDNDPAGPVRITEDTRRVRVLTIVVVTVLLAAAVTAQLKASLVPSSNRVARDQQLVNSARTLESDNVDLRAQLRSIQDQIKRDNERLAQTSESAMQAQLAARDQKERAGMTKVSGPGISIELGNGNDPHIPGDNRRDWLVKYLDIQDVVNQLWSANAEAVSVNGQRVVTTSSFYVAGADVLLNGVHLTAPYRIEAIGDGGRLNDALSNSNNLAELKSRSDLYQLKLKWQTERNLTLPAYDGAFTVRSAVAG